MSEIAQDFSPLIRLYKDGRVERLAGTASVPASLDPETNVHSKDVVYLPEAAVSCRLYLPKSTNPDLKLPILVYFHGGGFCVESSSSPLYHNYLNTLVEEANVIAVSVDYRRAPEHTVDTIYDDSWAAIRWVAGHVNGNGPEEWLNSRADFGKVFFAGDSAGGNISYHMGMRQGQENLVGINVVGIILIHPFFWGEEPLGNEPKELEKRAFFSGIWHLACPTASGCDDPLINPFVDSKLASLGCTRVLVIVAGKDALRDRGWCYYEKLGKSGWQGQVEIMEAKEEGHTFHLFNPTCVNAAAMLRKVVSFLKQENNA